MLKNFITIIARPTDIFYMLSSKGKEKNISLIFSNKNIKDFKKIWIGKKTLVLIKNKTMTHQF